MSLRIISYITQAAYKLTHLTGEATTDNCPHQEGSPALIDSLYSIDYSAPLAPLIFDFSLRLDNFSFTVG